MHTQKDFSLTEFMELIIVGLSDKKVLPPVEDWHSVLYRLQKDALFSVEAVKKLRFDWNGLKPKSQEITETLNGFILSGCLGFQTPSFCYTVISVEIIKTWRQQLAEKLPDKSVANGIARAVELFVISHRRGGLELV